MSVLVRADFDFKDEKNGIKHCTGYVVCKDVVMTDYGCDFKVHSVVIKKLIAKNPDFEKLEQLAIQNCKVLREEYVKNIKRGRNMELKATKELVENLLREYPALRGNDDLLYLEVLRKTHPYWNSGRITTNIENMPIGEFFAERRNMKLPSFESVRRSRAKIMEEHPELKPCEKVQKGREIQREKYYDMYSKWKDLKQQDFDF